MTQIQEARRGIVTAEVAEIARREEVTVDFVRERVCDGRIVVFGKGTAKMCGIGSGLTTKVNANLGASTDLSNLNEELKKVDRAVEAGSDTIMDLSVGPQTAIYAILSAVVKRSTVPVGTVPVYAAFAGKKPLDVTEDDFFNAVEQHVKTGVDYTTVHAAITKEGVRYCRERVIDVVSKGGGLIAAWMLEHQKENPYYSNFDYLLELLKSNDVVLSIGDALRPGCLADAGDKAQLSELRIQGELVKRAREKGVGVICEGPGHVPLNEIPANVALQKEWCYNAPYYVLGPLTCDIGAGHDHVTGAIGGAIAAASGVDFLCVVTPAEHLCLPDEQDIHDGVLATKIAAHSGDIVKLPKARERDKTMSIARGKLDWATQFKHALDPKKSIAYRKRTPTKTGACSMCGDYCPMRLMNSMEDKVL